MRTPALGVDVIRARRARRRWPAARATTGRPSAPAWAAPAGNTRAGSSPAPGNRRAASPPGRPASPPRSPPARPRTRRPRRAGARARHRETSRRHSCANCPGRPGRCAHGGWHSPRGCPARRRTTDAPAIAPRPRCPAPGLSGLPPRAGGRAADRSRIRPAPARGGRNGHGYRPRRSRVRRGCAAGAGKRGTAGSGPSQARAGSLEKSGTVTVTRMAAGRPARARMPSLQKTDENKYYS
ncbi:Uncharacterised protein [Bordetella pertussis]|nr:Uncharacterised protein [Bordetella pertussis]